MKTSKEKKLELLRLTRKTITLENRGICRALRDLCDTAYNRAERIHITEYIRHQLGRFAYLDGWVKMKIGDREWEATEPEEREQKMFATRLAWLDWMIACYEEDLK